MGFPERKWQLWKADLMAIIPCWGHFQNPALSAFLSKPPEIPQSRIGNPVDLKRSGLIDLPTVYRVPALVLTCFLNKQISAALEVRPAVFTVLSNVSRVSYRGFSYGCLCRALHCQICAVFLPVETARLPFPSQGCERPKCGQYSQMSTDFCKLNKHESIVELVLFPLETFECLNLNSFSCRSFE